MEFDEHLSLDDSLHPYVRGSGILAKQSELNDDAKFESGCRSPPALAFVAALIRSFV